MRGELLEVAAGQGPEWAAMAQLAPGARDACLVDAEHDLRGALATLDVVLVGTGSVGMHLSRLAAQSGVRSLLLVDRGRLKPESFRTHPCHPRDLGRAKALVGGEYAKALSPHTRVEAYCGDFEELSTDKLAGAGVLLLGSDNLRCEASVGARAIELGIPLIQGSVHGATLTADVRVFSNQPGSGSACPACGFQQLEWRAYDRGTLFSCAGDADTPAGAALPSRTPTASPPQLCGHAADLVFAELTRRLIGIDDPAQSRIVQSSGYTLRNTLTPLHRNPACPIDHETAQVVALGAALPAATPRELVGRAGLEHEDPRRVTLRVESHRYAAFASCECDVHSELSRFYRVQPADSAFGSGDGPGRCAKCDAKRAFHPLHTRTEVPVSLLAPVLDRPLAEIGADTARVVRLRGEAGSVLFHRGRFAPHTPSHGEALQ